MAERPHRFINICNSITKMRRREETFKRSVEKAHQKTGAGKAGMGDGEKLRRGL